MWGKSARTGNSGKVGWDVGEAPDSSGYEIKLCDICLSAMGNMDRDQSFERL